MKRLTTTIFLILCLSLGIVVLQPVEDLYGIEYDVRVINGFTNNSSLPLVIWCSSGDSDLGGRALQEGDDFSWSLTTTNFFWGSFTGNNFLCTMKWDAKRKRFDAFNVPRDSRRCYNPFRKCSWLVKEDGFYFSNDEVTWKKDFSWF
ncbi:hypothetical protein Ddye_019069 [Dipteronia dyeriana]|uniref:S-protein homolog n=1 Tax=Dipteronia dyeriana TaxID=168575 RepID=A0AAD9WU32_9ROSI|nr:hypothetical protein Ddye_019069 [Dipteronia dyeriana]